jgi:hypothetical protein
VQRTGMLSQRLRRIQIGFPATGIETNGLCQGRIGRLMRLMVSSFGERQASIPARLWAAAV